MNKEGKFLKDWQTQFLSYILGLEQSFVHSIAPISSLSEKSCCEIYKRGYKARLIESLGVTFEATWWVLGDDDFMRLASDFISSNLSKNFDLADYGSDFPKYLLRDSITSEIPFISELANFEWRFKNIFHSVNIRENGKNLLMSLQSDPSVTISLQKSCELWHSNYSIYEIWKRRGEDVTTISQIDWSEKESLILYKAEHKIYIKNLNKFDYILLRFFEEKSTLESAVQKYRVHFGDPEPELITNFFSKFGSLSILSVE